MNKRWRVVLGQFRNAGFHDGPVIAGNRPGTPTEQMRIPNVFETVLRATNVQSRNMLAVGLQPADFSIPSDVSDVDASDFQHAEDTAAIGKAAAEKALPDLLEQSRQLDASLVSGLE